jgi:hypothetical protein
MEMICDEMYQGSLPWSTGWSMMNFAEEVMFDKKNVK